MAGVTWRQHRIALAGVAVLLGALAVWLWIIGTPLHHAYAAAVACHPANSAACQALVGTFNGINDHMTGPTSPGGVFLQAVPVLIGAFVGAPVLARELETGTFRYAWTQGFGRWRWALAKLVLLAVVLAAAAGACGVLVSWYYQPYFAARQPGPGPFPDTPVRYPVQPARGRVPRLDAGRLRDRRAGRHAHPPGRPRDRRHPGRLRRARRRGRRVLARALPDPAGHQQRERARHRVDHQPVVDQGRQVRLRAISPSASSTSSALPLRQGRASLRLEHSRSASPRTATRSGPATSRPAGSGHSSGSRAAGCSRCQRCSSQRPSGWSSAAPPDASRHAAVAE